MVENLSARSSSDEDLKEGISGKGQLIALIFRSVGNVSLIT